MRTSIDFDTLDDLDTAPRVARIRRPATRPGLAVATFGHAQPVFLAPALARAVAGLPRQVR